MTFLDTKQQRAAWVVAILGILIVLGLTPFFSGLIGGPILWVLLSPLHGWLVPRVRSRRAATIIVILVALVGIVLPVTWVISLLVSQAQTAATGVVNSPILDRLDSLTIGPYAVGQEIKNLGSRLVGLMGGGAISLLGKVTRIALNVLFAFFGLYYIAMQPAAAWRLARPFIPFSDENVEILRQRFAAVTKATVLGSGLCAVTQGTLVAIAFTVLGLGSPIFWGAVTALFALVPVLGSSLVWLPGSVVLFTQGRTGAAIGLALFGFLVVSQVDNLIRPWVSNRYAQVHPMITLVGAIAGVGYLGILGLLIGPLALSYFFELVRMYQREYLDSADAPGMA